MKGQRRWMGNDHPGDGMTMMETEGNDYRMKDVRVLKKTAYTVHSASRLPSKSSGSDEVDS